MTEKFTQTVDFLKYRSIRLISEDEQYNFFQHFSDSDNFRKTVLFGSYPQGKNGEVKPIEWQVIKSDCGKSLLLSRYALDSRFYHDSEESIVWDKCSLKLWLNGEFYKSAFTDSEKNMILFKYQVDSSISPLNMNFIDTVFILDADEIRDNFYPSDYICLITDYLKEKIGLPSVKYLYNDEVAQSCSFFVRGSSSCPSDRAEILRSPDISYPGEWVKNGFYKAGVRPAIWVKL